MAGKLCIYKLLFWFVFGDRAGFCSAHLHLYNNERRQIYFLAVSLYHKYHTNNVIIT